MMTPDAKPPAFLMRDCPYAVRYSYGNARQQVRLTLMRFE